MTSPRSHPGTHWLRLVAADLSDERLERLVDEVTAFGYRRVAERVLPRALRSQVEGYAAVRARALGTAPPHLAAATADEVRYASVIPDLHPSVRGREFSVTSFEAYRTYLASQPDAFTQLGLSSNQARWIVNFVNGGRSVVEIRQRASAGAGEPISLEQAVGYLELLREVGWVVW